MTAPKPPSEMTLNEVLAHLGYTTLDAPHHRKHVLRDGDVVLEAATASQAATWLRKSGQWPPSEALS